MRRWVVADLHEVDRATLADSGELLARQPARLVIGAVATVTGS
jgi:hypothetical protein